LSVVDAKSEHAQQATHRQWLSASQTRTAAQISEHRQQFVAVVLAALTLALLLSFFGRWAYDDPYITFRYARNLLDGNGFVYNVGQRTLSTTAPLYAIFLAGLGWAWPDLPSLANVLSALSLVLSALILYGWARRRGEKASGMLAALLLCLWPLLYLTFGSETLLSTMLILGGLWAYDRSRTGFSAGMLALATMIRPDAIIAAISLGLVHLFRRQSIPWRSVALYVGLVGAFYAAIWLYFGSPLPVTLLAKQQQGLMAGSMRFGAGFVDLARQYAHQPFYWLHALLALVGLYRVLRKRRYWIPLLAWTALYFAAYTVLGVSRYFWYYAPLIPALAVLVAEGTVAVLRALSRTRLSRPLTLVLTGLLLVALLVPLLTDVIGAGWHSDPRHEVYREIGQWLRENTRPEASIGALEVGIIGYYAQRPIVDFAGLVQPDVARRFATATTYQESGTWTIQNYQPDYVLLHRDSFSGVAESAWFRSAYQPVRDFTNQQAASSLTQEVLWLTLYQQHDAGSGEGQ
jgi:hypothetical protein